jgi:hypothetical protein
VFTNAIRTIFMLLLFTAVALPQSPLQTEVLQFQGAGDYQVSDGNTVAGLDGTGEAG